MKGRFAGWLIYFQLCQIGCLCSKIPLQVQVLHPSCWQDLTCPVAWFQYAENVCHTQFGQFCIWASTLGPFAGAACS